MAKLRMAGFQKPQRTPKDGRPVGMAVVSYQEDGSVVCSCGGWVYRHIRPKVIEDAIDRHIERKHNGRGFRR